MNEVQQEERTEKTSNPPSAVELALALDRVVQKLGLAADDAICHRGIRSRAKCARCSAIDHANELLDRTPIDWFRG